MRKLLMAAIAACLLVFAAPGSAQDFESGELAFHQGNYEVALSDLRPLAKRNDPIAQFNLGGMYREGLGVSQDNAEAAKWFLRAAIAGHAMAQHNIGIMYLEGKGVIPDVVEAVKWFSMAAAQGDANSQYIIGIINLDGTRDFVEAAKWLGMAAEQGHVHAQTAFGLLHWTGRGVAQDYAEAAKWCRPGLCRGGEVVSQGC